MDKKSFFLVVGVIIVFFVIPFFYRKYKDKNIQENICYTIGIVTKKTGSLKNGTHWHYRFKYKGKEYENYKPTHINYNVNIGEYFLVTLSSKKPEFNNILYKDKLENGQAYYGISWDTIPFSLLQQN